VNRLAGALVTLVVVVVCVVLLFKLIDRL